MAKFVILFKLLELRWLFLLKHTDIIPGKEQDPNFEEQHHKKRDHLEDNHEIEVVDEERIADRELAGVRARKSVQCRLREKRMVVASGEFERIGLLEWSE